MFLKTSYFFDECHHFSAYRATLILEGTQYHQISECAMGSPVSMIIAELVMQKVEEKELHSSPIKPKWWCRYVDDQCLTFADCRLFK